MKFQEFNYNKGYDRNDIMLDRVGVNTRYFNSACEAIKTTLTESEYALIKNDLETLPISENSMKQFIHTIIPQKKRIQINFKIKTINAKKDEVCNAYQKEKQQKQRDRTYRDK